MGSSFKLIKEKLSVKYKHPADKTKRVQHSTGDNSFCKMFCLP